MRFSCCVFLFALIAAVTSSGLAFGGGAAPPPATPPRPAEAYDYQLRGASQKLRVFFLAREQLKLVIVGDSRGHDGVNPLLFYSGEKVNYPQALNLALDFAGLDTQVTIVDDYVLHAPKLKWVVWQLSPRLFNKYYQGGAMEMLRKSPGYQYDQSHKDVLWATPPMKIFRPNDLMLDPAFPKELGASERAYRAWGWHEDRLMQLDPEEQKQFFKTSMNGKFELDPARWQRFEQILGDLAKRNVKVLGFVSPMYHSMVQSPCADDDGTLDPDYWAEMKELENLQAKYPNYFFYDFHRDGRNEFRDGDYINSDHLNAVGAAKLTAKLVAIQKAIDAQSKLDVTPPGVRSITAVGDGSQVTVVLSETVGAAEAANPANYAIGKNIAVLAASLGDDKRTVTLKTSPLFEGIGYTLTVGNVKDKMDNVISPKPIPFRFAKTLEIRETSPKNYAWDSLAVGGSAYVDQPRSYAKIPDHYLGLRALKTAEADIASTGDAFVSFNVNYPVRVYVAHDAAVKMKPSWMDAFTWTWDSVEIDKDKYRMAYKDFPAGTVTLGGNQGPAGKMYVVFVQPMGAMNASAR